MKLIDYFISPTTDIDALKSELGRSFTALKEATEKMTADIYDTFDWRLHQNGWQLFRQNNHFQIIHSSTGRLISEIEVDSKSANRFSWEFPASDFADQLAPVLEMRALIPMATIKKKINQLAVCNADEKIVARLEFESLTIKNKPQSVTHCRLLPVKGYGKESRRIMDIIEDLKLIPTTVSAVVDLFQQNGIEPGAYSSKINVTLKPEIPAVEALRLILNNLTTVMHQNLEGVREDIDSEFLHDLRVAVRRARSLLGQMKGVYAAEITAALQAHLKTLGVITGEVRDLDVYLLKKSAYVNQVPEALKPGIVQLFRALQRKRRTARDRMVKAMAGAEFKSALAALEDFIQSDPMTHAESPAGIAPIGDLAKAAITRRYRQVMKKGGRISATTPDEQLHKLRIDCKKLRYLLEFFSSLFPDDQMKLLIKQLKQLQDNLGDFNDLSVQQDFLAGYLDSIKPQAPQALILAAATGGLITRLAMDQGRIRAEFLSVFEAFSSRENKLRFKALFA